MRKWVPLALFMVTLLVVCRLQAEQLPNVSHLLKAASKGNVDAQYTLGRTYEFGRLSHKISSRPLAGTRKPLTPETRARKRTWEACTPRATVSPVVKRWP